MTRRGNSVAEAGTLQDWVAGSIPARVTSLCSVQAKRWEALASCSN